MPIDALRAANYRFVPVGGSCLFPCYSTHGLTPMVRVSFTQNIQRHVGCPTTTVEGETIRGVLDAVFALNQRARSYILDEHGAVRRHMIVFINGQPILDRETLTDAVPAGANVCIMQALSGG